MVLACTPSLEIKSSMLHLSNGYTEKKKEKLCCENLNENEDNKKFYVDIMKCYMCDLFLAGLARCTPEVTLHVLCLLYI